MIFVPLLHYFKCKNSYSGNEYGLRYRMIPGKRTVPDPDGGEGATKVFPLTDEGRESTAAFLQDAFNADPDRWKNCPSMMDSDPWEPPAAEAEPDKPKE